MATSTESNPRRRFFGALLSCAILVGLSIALVDRPASTWAHATLHEMDVFPWLTHLVDPTLPVAAVVLALAGVGALSGWRLPSWFKTLIACCLATVIAVVIKDQLKHVCGRLWPETWTNHNPSWIGNGAYGFFPFHGGEGWESFPSGHMTRITAFMAVLWLRVPRLRWLWLTLALLVGLGLFGADYHFIGDIIAGAYLGTACAVGVHTWMFRHE
jgi:membrane-associated phospholipid phosphatase